MQFKCYSPKWFAASLALMWLAACSVPPTVAPTAAPVPTNTPVPTSVPFVPLDAVTQAQQLGRGINFGNALEAPAEGAWGLTLNEKYFDAVKQAGFQTVRLPVKWSAHADTKPPYKIDETFFQRVDWAIAQANQRGLNIVVNIHNYDELMSDPTNQQPRFNAIWAQIAARYKDQPASVLFELLNEPHQMSSNLWNQLAVQAIKTIRPTNPTRNLIVGGADFSSVNGLLDLKLPADDPHLIATFHYYQPLMFTHQGASWVSGSDAWLGTKWLGTSNERSLISFDLGRAAQWGADNARPVWLGEFGAYEKADPDSRVRWTSYVARQAEKENVNWAYWDFATDFGAYDLTQQAWKQPLLQSLIP